MNNYHVYVNGLAITEGLLDQLRDLFPEFRIGDSIVVHRFGEPERTYRYAKIGDPCNTCAKSYPQFTLEDLEQIANRMIDARLDAMLKDEGIDYNSPIHPVKYLDHDELVDMTDLLMSCSTDEVLVDGGHVFCGRPLNELTTEQLRKLYLYLYHQYGGTTA